MTTECPPFPFPRCWEIPELTEINRLPARATFFPFPDAEKAATRNPSKSKWVRSLDGEWDFDYFESPEDVDAHLLTRKPKGKQTVTVPGNWTRQGYDKPHYTNELMPFENNPPLVPKQNPTGLYRRVISIPKTWSKRRNVLHIGGMESAGAVYVDGNFVGWASDTRLPSEFNLTSYLEPGKEHVLAILVIRYSAFSYCEDQDQWWMAGIHRSVKLISTDTAWLEDIFAKTGYQPRQKTGTLDLTIRCGFDGPHGRKCRAEVQLKDAGDKAVWQKPASMIIDGTSYRSDGFSGTVERRIENCAPWSAESPSLYTLHVSLRDAESGKLLEATCIRVGFKSVEVKNGQMLFNGQPILIKGVNRHDHDPDHGKAVDRKWLLGDIRLLKEHHFNAVRTAHYPNDPEFLDLCDEAGLYVMDEANQECHANYRTMARDFRWQKTFVERMERMVLRDRNHASVFSWSVGNETGYGRNHDLAADAARTLDDSRLVINAEVCRTGWTQSNNRYTPGGERGSDVHCPMYVHYHQLEALGKKPQDGRPVILSEYSHAMGNSNGGLKDLWDLFYTYPTLQGGFIWDWVEQGLRETGPDGKEFWAYGGDYGDEPNDVNFNCNGLVMPDRIPKPALEECKHIFQPVALTRFDQKKKQVTLLNRDFFRSSERFQWTVSVKRNEETIYTLGLGSLSIAPRKTKTLRIPYPDAALNPGEELVLHLDGTDNAGTCCHLHQVLSRKAPRLQKKTARPVPEELPWIPDLHVIRGWTDNDGVKGKASHWQADNRCMGRSHTAGLDQLSLADETCSPEEDEVVLRRAYNTPTLDGAIRHTQRHAFYADGWVRMTHQFQFDTSLPDLPRVGVRLELPDTYTQVEWRGLGPVETYSDRKTAGIPGRYTSTVEDLFFPYIVPQETGNHEEVLWICARDADGNGLMACSNKRFSASVLPYTTEEIIKAPHPYELPKQRGVHLNLDVCQRGLGTRSCGQDTLPHYQIPPGEFRFTWWIRPLNSRDDPDDLTATLPGMAP